MGTWDTGYFDNDNASSFLSHLEDSSDYSNIVKEFDALLALGTDYIEIDCAYPTIAAAEVVAHALGVGRSSKYASETIEEWLELECQQSLPEGLVDKAILACSRILEPPSEALELWFESDDLEEWRQNVLDLIHRLKTVKHGEPGKKSK